MKRIALGLMLILCMGVGMSAFVPAQKAEAAGPVLKAGAHDGYVWGLQNRLQQLGLYSGKVDGFYGPVTRYAVIQFQNRNHLAADGIAGPVTFRSLRKQSFTSKQLKLFAQLVYAEARGESFKGQVAVAAVVLNRIDSDQFPDTLSGVVYEPRAFSCVANGAIQNHPDKEAYRAVYAAISGWDPSQGALFYFNPDKSDSTWMRSLTVIVRIGHHVFEN
jgi:N-acetylmuramoyl-L-alanine amidase